MPHEAVPGRGSPDGPAGSPFSAAHRSFSHRIRVDLPAAEAVDLFTPLGERAWIAEWDPTFLHPVDGRTQPGLVFTTGEAAELTFWTVADFDRSAGRARYMRVTPASRSVIVAVRVVPLGQDACEAEVEYHLTGLTTAGNDAIVAMTESSYAAMIDEWAGLIAAHLADRSDEQV